MRCINKMNQPLISVIIPVYNVEKYLKHCIDSVINQSYKNLQIILVDDGSPDNCPQICDEYTLLDSRIEVIHKPNGGTASARNAGIEAVKGEYISFVDSDDYINCNMYSQMYKNIVKYNADICECDHIKVKKYKNSYTAANIKKYSAQVYTGMDFIKRRYLQDHLNSVIVCNKLFRADVFSSIRFPEGSLLEDLCTSYKTFFCINKIVVISAKLYCYVQRGGSATYNSALAGDFAVEAYNDMEKLCLEHVSDISEADIYSGLITMCKQNEILDSYYTAYLNSNKQDMDKYANIYAQNKRRLSEINYHFFNMKCFLFDINKKLFVFAFRIRNLYHGIIDKKVRK